MYHFTWLPFNKINLLADVVTEKKVKNDTVVVVKKVIVEKKGKQFDLALYNKPHLITDFNADTLQPALPELMRKLAAIKKGGKHKIRIAYMGDSMIEGDLLSQTFRKLMQQQFGGSGVGFVPINSPVAGMRITAVTHASPDWQDNNFKGSAVGLRQIYLSGHTFYSNNSWVEMRDNTIIDSAAIIEKSLLCGYLGGGTNVMVNNGVKTIGAPYLVNRIAVANDAARYIKLNVNDNRLPLYGISFESDNGVFVDNFSFRGITGIEFNNLDTSFLISLQQNNPYDLIILQYGVNLMFRPNDTHYGWYHTGMSTTITKLKKAFPQTDFLLISAGDRAFRYGGEYKSATGIDTLIHMQANMAYETGCSFYNQFLTMGGKGSIVEWANAKPSLAGKDYIHPNGRGCEILANKLFDAFMNDYNKYAANPEN